ncbi:glycoside hydrolase family 47 protein [Backusella circina FSU 941]|nr:glycoside hydrolase family 47 protein [Backusella circina FSU 941]
MVLSYILGVPKRWRLFLLAVFIVVILCQIWITQSGEVSIRNFNKLKNKGSNHSNNTVTERKHPHSRPARKQSILYGVDGFNSQVPLMQYDFPPEPAEYTSIREKRRLAVKKSFLHGWNGYKQYAMGHDELRPLSNTSNDPFGGWGATMVDSLSTMMIMELEDEAITVLPFVKKINFNVEDDLSVFESIIRYLGGLLSAYELSEKKHDVLLHKAEELAQVLLPAFETESGLPTHTWNPIRNKSNSRNTLFAEVGTVQLEFMMLSQLTGNPIYGKKAQAIIDLLENMGYESGVYIKGLYPTSMDTKNGYFRDATSTFGAMGDSAFEYFLKEHILVDGTRSQYGRMYTESIKSMKQYMLQQIPGYDMLLLPPYNTRQRQSSSSMDHLTCFVPGMLAMGSKIFNEPEDMEIAKGLLETCVFMYRTTKTGLCPENWYFQETEPYNQLTYNKSHDELMQLRNWWYGDKKPIVATKPNKKGGFKTDYSINYKLPDVKERPEKLYFGDNRYIHRPETVESLLILYRITGDRKYQEYGWEIYKSIEKWCKTKSAYAIVRDVDRIVDEDDIESNQNDSMETFIFAETFKYLYLLFSPPEIISLDKFVFNTEAHPFLRRHWNWNNIIEEETSN